MSACQCNSKQWGQPEWRPRVMVVDDAPCIRDLLVSFIQRSGRCELAGCASDGWGAVEWFAAMRPDLILMDLNMPGMNGLVATRLIKLEAGAPLVVVMSLDNSLAHRKAARADEADGFISKAHLHAGITAWLDHLCGGSVPLAPHGWKQRRIPKLPTPVAPLSLAPSAPAASGIE